MHGFAATHDLSSTPDGAAGSFSLPFSFYATVTVYAPAGWPDGKVTTNASWAIPVADCDAPTSPAHHGRRAAHVHHAHHDRRGWRRQRKWARQRQRARQP